MAEGVTVANAFVQVMPSMEGATDNITKAILPGMESAGTKAGVSFGGMFTGKVGALLKGAGVAALGYLAFDNLKDAFVEVEAGFNKVVLATGATGESAQQLKSVYLDVSKNVVGSFEDIGSAVGEINTRLGLNGEELEKASEQMMKYAKVTGQDATKATQDVASMMRNAGIPAADMGTTLDKLTRAGQAAGIDVSNLANNVTKYNAVMKEMGFTTDEQIALMAQFELSGADTASVLNAMKKGVAEWAKEGKNAGEEFKKFVQGVQDGTVTSGDAVELFGTKGGLSLYEAAKKGQLSFDEMYETIINDSEGALDSVYTSTLTAQEKFDLLGKQVQTGFYEIVEPIVDAIEPYMDDIIAAISQGVQWFVTEAVPVIKEIIDFVGELIKNLSDLAQDFADTGNAAAAFASDVANTVGTAVDNIVNWWSSLPSRIGSFLSEVWNNVVNTFNGIVDFVMNIPNTIVSFFTGLGSRITSAFGSIHFPTPHISYWDISIADWKVPIPYVQWYARGGFVDEPQYIGAGEAGPEMVLPKQGKLMDEFAGEIAKRIGSGGVDIHDCTFVVRRDSDIRRVAVELNTLINRQTAGGIA